MKEKKERSFNFPPHLRYSVDRQELGENVKKKREGREEGKGRISRRLPFSLSYSDGPRGSIKKGGSKGKERGPSSEYSAIRPADLTKKGEGRRLKRKGEGKGPSFFSHRHVRKKKIGKKKKKKKEKKTEERKISIPGFYRKLSRCLKGGRGRGHGPQ